MPEPHPVDLTENKRVAAAFLDLAFNGREPAKAFDAYVGADYVQHNPHAPDGAAASAVMLAGFVARFPELRLEIKRVIAEGDLVVTHSRMQLAPGDRGSAIMDMLRFCDGRIVEHWDVAQEIPEHPANPNTMF